ncbi:MAG: dimethyl sulfoxide reductase anchor subunit family protein, partial [Acidimicrobiia bacterium]
LTQLSAGAFGSHLALRALAGEGVAATLAPANALVALGLGLLALAASLAHLGRPLQAWRAVIGLRHSWLSREIVAFSAFAGLAVAYAGALWLGPAELGAARDGLGVLVAGVGAFGVGCSVMIYAVTGRPWWGRKRTAVRFALTAVACGLATTLAASLAGALVQGGEATARAATGAAVPFALLVAAAMSLKLAGEGAFLLRARESTAPETDLDRSARLLLGPDLGGLTRWRFGLGLSGGVVLPLVVAALCATPDPSLGAGDLLAVAAALGIVAGELCERAGFFAAVTSPSMPRELP